MDKPARAYRFGDWCIEPHLNRITRGDEEQQLEPLTMNVLAYLAENAGEVVTADAPRTNQVRRSAG